MVMTVMGMVVGRVTVRLARLLPAIAGMFLCPVPLLVVVAVGVLAFATATIAVRFGRVALR